MNKIISFVFSSLLVISCVFISPLALATDEELEEYTKAVEKTQKDLANSAQRQQMINSINSADSKDAAARVNEVTGGNQMDQETIYKLSSQILGEIKGKDSEALKSALLNAQKDPQKFLQSLSPEMQKQIRELAGRIEERQKKKP